VSKRLSLLASRKRGSKLQLHTEVRVSPAVSTIPTHSSVRCGKTCDAPKATMFSKRTRVAARFKPLGDQTERRPLVGLQHVL